MTKKRHVDDRMPKILLPTDRSVIFIAFYVFLFSWIKETCIHVKLGNFIFFSIWFSIVLYINRWFVINKRYSFSSNYL